MARAARCKCTLSPAEQNGLEIRFGVITPDPAASPPAKTKTKAECPEAVESVRLLSSGRGGLLHGQCAFECALDKFLDHDPRGAVLDDCGVEVSVPDAEHPLEMLCEEWNEVRRE